VLFSRFLPTRRQGAPLASLCAICHGWGMGRICSPCVDRFAAAVPRCERCALPVPAGVPTSGACVIDPPPYARTLAAVDYGHPWDRLITRYKFHAALDLAPAFALRMLETQRRDAEPPPTLVLPTLLLPIPLSDSRLRERGYNQAWELARRLGRALACPADAKLLLRVRDTPHQLALPPEERAGNVRAAFAVEPSRRAELAGRRVTLVDDVMTTGATVAEAARTLLQAGAQEVTVWVLARTPRPGSP
jgi:ComF family protein